MKFGERVSKAFNAAAGVTLADGDLYSEAASQRQVRSERMKFGKNKAKAMV